VNECRECKDYHKCPFIAGKAWYGYGEIRFCPFQIMWVIFHSDILGEDGDNEALFSGGGIKLSLSEWPPNPDGSSYTAPLVKTGLRDEAYFAKPEEILAEVEARLKTTGTAGETLIEEVKQGLNIDQLSHLARRALMYAKGWRRKSLSFPRWQAQQRYRRVLTTKSIQR